MVSATFKGGNANWKGGKALSIRRKLLSSRIAKRHRLGQSAADDAGAVNIFFQTYEHAGSVGTDADDRFRGLGYWLLLATLLHGTAGAVGILSHARARRDQRFHAHGPHLRSGVAGGRIPHRAIGGAGKQSRLRVACAGAFSPDDFYPADVSRHGK